MVFVALKNKLKAFSCFDNIQFFAQRVIPVAVTLTQYIGSIAAEKDLNVWKGRCANIDRNSSAINIESNNKF